MKINITRKKNKIKISRADVSDLDNTLARIIVPALKKYRKHCNSYPSDITENEKTAKAEWQSKVNKMIYAFEECKSYPTVAQNSNLKRIEEGLQLFATNFRKLWI